MIIMMFSSNINNRELEPFHKVMGVDFTISLTDLLQSRLFEVETIIENKMYRAYPLFHCNEISSTNTDDKIIENKCLILQKRERETYLSFITNPEQKKINLTHELEESFSFYGIGDELTMDEFNKYVYSLRENTVFDDALNLNDNYITSDDVHIDLSVFSNYKNNIILNNLTLKGSIKKVEDSSLLKNKTLNIYNYNGSDWNLIRSVTTNSRGEYSFIDYSFIDFIDNSSIGSRDELQSLIDDTINNNLSEITLTKQYRFNNGDSFITIPDTLKINGNGHIINADGKSRVFEVTGDNVVLDNLILENGNTSGEGGCIKWSGDNGKLSNTVIVNCISNDDGGAVHWTGEQGIIEQTRFVNNATNENGGAIYAEVDNFKILNIICFNNLANGNGGAIRTIGNRTVIDGVIVEKNTSNGSVGNRGIIANTGDNARIFNIDAYENYFGRNRVDRTSKAVDNTVQYKIVLSIDNEEYYSTINGFNLLTRTANTSHGETKGIVNCKGKYANYRFYNASNQLVNNEGIIITNDLKNNPLRVKLTDSFFEFANHNLTFTVKNLNDADINDVDNEDNILDSFTLKLKADSEIIIPLNDYENDSVLLFDVDASIDFHVLEIQRRNLLKLSADKNIIAPDDEITLTATYLDTENNPLPNEDIVLKANDTVLDTVTTDSAGVASYEYIPLEDCTIIAESEDDVQSIPVNVTVKEFDNISITCDKSVLSYYNSDSCNLTAQLTLNDEPVSIEGVNVTFVVTKASDGTLLESLDGVTDADGSCTKVYNSHNYGDIHIQAYARMFVSETYELEDSYMFNDLTNQSQVESLWNVPSNVKNSTYNFSDDGWTMGNVSPYTRIPNRFTLPDLPYAVSFKINQLTTVGLTYEILSSSLYLSSGSDGKIGIVSRPHPWVLSHTYTLKVYSDKVELYDEDSLVQTYPVGISGSTIAQWGTGSNRILTIKDFKIKTL